MCIPIHQLGHAVTCSLYTFVPSKCRFAFIQKYGCPTRGTAKLCFINAKTSF